MTPIDRRIAREAKAMMRIEVLSKAFAKQITWLQAADILGITTRHLRRVRRSIETHGMPEALRDKRQGTPRRPRVSALTIAKICRLRRPDGKASIKRRNKNFLEVTVCFFHGANARCTKLLGEPSLKRSKGPLTSSSCLWRTSQDVPDAKCL